MVAIAYLLEVRRGLSSGFSRIDQGNGTGGTPAGSRIIGIGYRAVEEFLGSDVVAIGHEARRSLLASSDMVLGSIFIGNHSGSHALQKTDSSTSIAIGHGTYSTRDNQVVLGNADVQETVLRGLVKSAVYRVEDLPSANTVGLGSKALVSDAQSKNFNQILSGGGAGKVLVFSDGTVWRVG